MIKYRNSCLQTHRVQRAWHLGKYFLPSNIPARTDITVTCGSEQNEMHTGLAEGKEMVQEQ